MEASQVLFTERCEGCGALLPLEEVGAHAFCRECETAGDECGPLGPVHEITIPVDSLEEAQAMLRAIKSSHRGSLMNMRDWSRNVLDSQDLCGAGFWREQRQREKVRLAVSRKMLSEVRKAVKLLETFPSDGGGTIMNIRPRNLHSAAAHLCYACLFALALAAVDATIIKWVG